MLPPAEYAYLVRCLEAPFERFVRDPRVTAYLDSIGTDVLRRGVSTGFPREVVVVTGYEPERGTWAACSDHQIRFGPETIPVRGLVKPLVLSPNLFYGTNRAGFPVEYRLGLYPGFHRLHVYPVVVREDAEGFHGKVLPDLCVIHQGIQVDARTGREVSGFRAARLLSSRQFLTCLWNLDDYLRKQNPHFEGEFPDVWRAVETFSGRIVNQVLLSIAFNCRADPRWYLPAAEKARVEALVAHIQAADAQRSAITRNQRLVHVRNLNCFMVYFKNYWPLHELHNDGVNVAPAVLDLFLRDPRGGAVLDEIKCEAVTVLFQIAQKIPDALRVLVPTFVELFTDPEGRVENPLMYVMAVVVRRWPTAVPPATIRTYLEFLFRTFFRFRKLESYNYCRFFPSSIGEDIYLALVAIVNHYPQFKPLVRAATKKYLARSDRLLSRFATGLLYRCGANG